MDSKHFGKDRRKAVRVTGRNLFCFQPVSGKKYQAVAEDFSHGIPPYNQEGLVDLQMFISAQSALSRLRERDKDLAEFLQHLDAKVNQILRKMNENKTPFDDLSYHDLNLGGNGIGFVTDERIESGTILELHIVLLPDYSYVYCFSKVIECKELSDSDGGGGFRVASEFVLIMEEDQEKLIQHNFKQQSLALRNRRLQGASSNEGN
ncbi:MAG: PilZ domain-containing protein [Thermodesulfobacteriota bacterium]|nr:PilZ domain-containing protein [Thermodesulfobacteriota bacterium]